MLWRVYLMKKVAYIASECVPFIKTGGLADVVGTLPKIFDKNEYDVRVIMPNYLCIPNKYREKMQYITHFYMDIGYKNDYVGVMYLEYEGVKVYFIDNEYYFNGFTPYGDVKWDIEKFCYFSKAALSILPSIGFQPDILHCHDWQAGLVPVYLKTLFAGDMFYTSMKSVMTIHNLQFQGKWDIKTIQEYSGLPDYVFTPDKLEIQKDAEELAAKLEGVSLKIATKVSSTGTIFGSVGNIQIAEELAKLGHNIDRKIIVVKDAVKEVGNYKAIVKLHKEVSVEIPFEVVAEEA